MSWEERAVRARVGHERRGRAFVQRAEKAMWFYSRPHVRASICSKFRTRGKGFKEEGFSRKGAKAQRIMSNLTFAPLRFA
jgi:hypothetical protein